MHDEFPIPSPEIMQEIFPANTILAGYRGSVSQNTFLPNKDPDSIDDVDLIAVYIAHPSYYIGLGDVDPKLNTTGAYERFIGKWDSVAYEVRKAVHMLLNSNPNILPILWLEPKFYLVKTFWGDLLLQNREIFSSIKTWKAFKGYAKGQFHRMTHHEPTGLGYMGEKRRKLVRQFGFDCKNASHLIRLLRMGIEMLETGKLNVYRKHDSKELIDIKKGKWTLERVVEESEKLFDELEIAAAKSCLPEEPDRERANKVLELIITNNI